VNDTLSFEHAVSCVGVSHRHATLEQLERLSLSSSGLREALAPFTPRGPDGRRLFEGVVLSTCNRTEIYFTPRDAASEPDEPEIFRGLPPGLLQMLRRASGLSAAELAALLFRRDGWAAAEHLFRVVCGLDSLIAGESQIVGQVARAYAQAQAAGTAGVVLSTLFQAAIRGGRRARRRIGIGSSASNAGTAAVARAEKVVGSMAGARAVVVGTGELGRIVLHSLRARSGGCRVDVVSRSPERAAEVAARWGCEARTISGIPDLLAECDVLFSTTRALHPVVSAAMIGSAMQLRRGRPLVLVDLGVPRTIDPAAASVPGVRLLDIDSLKDDPVPAEATEEERRVQRLVAADLAELRARMTELSLRPVIGGMWRKAAAIRGDVLARARERLAHLDDRSWAEVEHLASSLVARILHDPAVRLRAEAGNGHSAAFAEALRELFRLEHRGGFST
jgi:glutamyl-tRNA reductase